MSRPGCREGPGRYLAGDGWPDDTTTWEANISGMDSHEYLMHPFCGVLDRLRWMREQFSLLLLTVYRNNLTLR